jgi:hypothetical protein
MNKVLMLSMMILNLITVELCSKSVAREEYIDKCGCLKKPTLGLECIKGCLKTKSELIQLLTTIHNTKAFSKGDIVSFKEVSYRVTEVDEHEIGNSGTSLKRISLEVYSGLTMRRFKELCVGMFTYKVVDIEKNGYRSKTLYLVQEIDLE